MLTNLTRPVRLCANRIRYKMLALAALKFGFFALCLRFQIASIREFAPESAPILIVIVGCLFLGAWNASAALFAFTAAVPLLVGLNQTVLPVFPHLPSLVFSALWTGIITGNLIRARRIKVSASHSDVNLQRSSGYYIAHRAELPNTVPFVIFILPVITHLLMASAFLSLTLQFWTHRCAPQLGILLFNRAIFGYGESMYFLSSAFVYLQGLFYFDLLCAQFEPASFQSKGSVGEFDPIACWLTPILTIYTVTIFLFIIFQFTLGLPVGWVGVWVAGSYLRAGFQAPYEDISSLGSVAVALFVWAIATYRPTSMQNFVFMTLRIVCLFIFVAASWSRAAWLAGTVFILLVALVRLPRLCSLGIVVLLVSATIAINENADRPSWTMSPYLSRLASLARFENPANKDAGRLNLYGKALRMLRAHPVLGFGIGSFYLTSVDYAAQNDPRASRPDFAHNAILQIGVEQGVPTAFLYVFVMAAIIRSGARTSLGLRSVNRCGSEVATTALGLTSALCAYLQTQMTANSLNVYTSSQFFFWFLAFGVLALSFQESQGSFGDGPRN